MHTTKQFLKNLFAASPHPLHTLAVSKKGRRAENQDNFLWKMYTFMNRSFLWMPLQ